MTASLPARAEACRKTALAIWKSGVAAVDSTRLVAHRLRVAGTQLRIVDATGASVWTHESGSTGRLIVVGAGKAGAGMVRGVEQALAGTALESRLIGWVNVPADCVRPSPKVTLHPARPAGLNEPTLEGCEGTEHILSLVASARPGDLVLVLLSGGGSALLPAPVSSITLADKQQVTRLLSTRGATIQELNTVRKRLSRVKGGGLARAAAGPVVALIISDVIGDPLDIIASGPTVRDPSTPSATLAILERFDPGFKDSPPAVVAELRRQMESTPSGSTSLHAPVTNLVIGNNCVACEAARAEAVRLGFDARVVAVDQPGVAEEVGRDLLRTARDLQAAMSPGQSPICLISGGEPTVRLAAYDGPRKGGRNQQLVLSAICESIIDSSPLAGLTILSGGTDGEDGPTDAAGAVADEALVQTARQNRLDPAPFLAIQNAYEFFVRAGGLIRTGPTHTNTMDVRVVLIESPRKPGAGRD